MLDPTLIFVGAVFALAGLAKGVIGLGLPTISMGLLAIMMSPVHAAAILLLPSFVTNVWQMVAGPTLGIVLRRLWPMMLAVCAGTWAGFGLMTGATAKFGTALLGIALVVYAITALAAWRWHVGWQSDLTQFKSSWDRGRVCTEALAAVILERSLPPRSQFALRTPFAPAVNFLTAGAGSNRRRMPPRGGYRALRQAPICRASAPGDPSSLDW
jgi:hypothetical protein